MAPEIAFVFHEIHSIQADTDLRITSTRTRLRGKTMTVQLPTWIPKTFVGNDGSTGSISAIIQFLQSDHPDFRAPFIEFIERRDLANGCCAFLLFEKSGCYRGAVGQL